MPRFLVLGFAACALALLSACGGGGGSSTPTAGVGAAATTPASVATSPAANTPAASASAAASPAGTTPAAGGATTLAIASPDDEKFDKKELTAPAGAKVTLTYTNDSDLAHDWHLFNGGDANSRSLAQTEIITGPNQKDTITFTAPSKPGRYFFHCDVHPTTMTGFLVVQ
ncbi:MAG TPA: cupredoxin domain-containing protein [Dehalococcoidia bacterium]|nr:cupredoxin domain-containing protein [Dehalococcoidia bacterium]